MSGMEVGMVFAIIFALIFMGFLLAFGMQTIADLLGIGGQAALQQALTNLDQAAGNAYNLASGSTQTFKFSLPGGARICFLTPPDYTKKPEQGWNPESLTVTAFLQNTNSSAYQANVWYYENGADRYGKEYNIPFLVTPFNFCRSAANLQLENQGDTVLVRLVN